MSGVYARFGDLDSAECVGFNALDSAKCAKCL